MEEKQEDPPGKFCSILPVMRCTDFYSATSKYHLIIKKPSIYEF